ncbi:MAG TPA: glycosyltransferase [Phycisphaeraceae bacterium]
MTRCNRTTSADDAHPAAPRVSVLMPVYNAQAFLPEAMDSILTQTLSDLELIAVDDGSRDGSLAILRDYERRDRRVRVLSRPNTGICGALNDGLAVARGVYIARMDADDWCAPDRLAKQAAYLDAHEDCVAVGAWTQRTDPYGSPAGSQEPPTSHEEIDAQLMRGQGNAMVHAALMIHAHVLRDIGGWREQYNWVEDLDLFLRLAERGRLANLPEYLYTYRRHTASVCAQHYELMCRRLKDVLREAYQRRGRSDLPDLDHIRPELPPRRSDAELFRNWACHAIHHGNKTLARKHALQAVRREPFSLKTWRVMYWSLCA